MYHFYRESTQALRDLQNGRSHYWVRVNVLASFMTQNQSQLARICVNDPDDDLFRNRLMIRLPQEMVKRVKPRDINSAAKREK